MRYHWGKGVSHAYSHIAQPEANPGGNHASVPTHTCGPISGQGDFEPNIDFGDQPEASAIPDNWENFSADSDDTRSDDTMDSAGSQSESLAAEGLMASYLDSESIHPGIEVLEYGDYRY